MRPDWKIVFRPHDGRLECLAGWEFLAPWRDLAPVFRQATVAILSMVAENIEASGNGLLLTTVEKVEERVGNVPGVEAIRAVLVGLASWNLVAIWNVGDGRFVFDIPSWRGFGRVSA